MSSLKAKEGMEFSSFSYTVDRGKIAEFVQAIGDPNPVYVDPGYAAGQGYRDVIAPPTFATCCELWGGLSFDELCATLQIDPLKVLHGEQEYEYCAAVYPGDRITGFPGVEAVARKEGKQGAINLITIATKYINQHGDQVFLGRSLIVVRE